MSDGPGIPRLLASMLGVEQPRAARPVAVPPQGPPRQAAPRVPASTAPAPQQPTSGGGLQPPPRLAPPERLQPRRERGPSHRQPQRGRPAAATAADPASTNPVRRPRPDHGDTGAAYVLPAAGDAAMTRAALREVLRSPAHARTAVLAAEVLAAPRGLRPYGTD